MGEVLTDDRQRFKQARKQANQAKGYAMGQRWGDWLLRIIGVGTLMAVALLIAKGIDKLARVLW